MKIWLQRFFCSIAKSGALGTKKRISLEENLVDGCVEKDLSYRRFTGKDKKTYVWMDAKKYVDANENTAIITLHNEKIA